MLYKGADLIRDVEFVIFDEVHYVNDAEVRLLNLSFVGFCLAHIVCPFCLAARSRLGGSHHPPARTRQHHPALSDRAEY